MINLRLNTLSSKKLLSLILILFACKSSVIQQGASAPELNLLKLDNQQVIIDLKELTLVNFFATWCSSCQEEVDELNRLKEIFPDLNIVSISNEKIDVLEKFSKRTKFNIYKDPVGKLFAQYKVSAVPETVLIKDNKFLLFRDPDSGEPTVKIKGSRTFSSPVFVSEIRRLMK